MYVCSTVPSNLDGQKHGVDMLIVLTILATSYQIAIAKRLNSQDPEKDKNNG